MGKTDVNFPRADPHEIGMTDFIGLAGAGHDTKWNKRLLTSATLDFLGGKHSNYLQIDGAVAYYNMVAAPKSTTLRRLLMSDWRDHCAKDPLSKIFGAVVSLAAAKSLCEAPYSAPTTAPKILRFWRSGRRGIASAQRTT
jgi:hypothetical protein